MAKGKAKNNSSSDSLAPPHPRSLRSRKRERPSDEISETDDVEATLHLQDTGRNHISVDATLLQCHQSPLQKSTIISPQPRQAAEQSCPTKQEPATEEKHAEATNVSLKNLMVTTIEVQEETTVTNPNNDSQLQGFRVHSDNDARQNGEEKEEVTAEYSNRPPSQTRTDQFQVLLPTLEEGNESCATALEEQLDAKESSWCNLERNKENGHEECSNVHMTDVKEVTKEVAVGLPAKKKRRMGACGLTERERSHFLQTQKRENGQTELERAERQICNNSAGLEAPEEIISSPTLPPSQSNPADSVTEQDEAEIKLQSSHCGGDNRAENEVHIDITTSDETSTVCDPGCSKGKSCEAEEDIVPGPELTGNTKSDPPAEEQLLGSQEHKECEGRTAESMTEKPQQEMKDGGDGSSVGDQTPAIVFYSNPAQNEETENQGAMEAALLRVNNIIRATDEKKDELTCDAGDGATPTDTQSGQFNCDPVLLCGAAVSPSGSERKDSCDPDDEPGAGSSTLNPEHPQTRDTTDLFGCGYLDYVSDSQLNTIALTEEETMEKEEDPGSPDCHDATDLICGLIRELSSLNRKVMATHRELENLRRSSKSSRGSTR